MLGLGQEDETPAHALSLAESGTSNSCELDPIWQQSLDDGIAPHINEASEGEKMLLRGRSGKKRYHSHSFPHTPTTPDLPSQLATVYHGHNAGFFGRQMTLNVLQSFWQDL